MNDALLQAIRNEEVSYHTESVRDIFIYKLHNFDHLDEWFETQKSTFIKSVIVGVSHTFSVIHHNDIQLVVEGQNKVKALQDFINGKFSLDPLVALPELSGMFYKDLPNKLKIILLQNNNLSIKSYKSSAAKFFSYAF